MDSAGTSFMALLIGGAMAVAVDAAGATPPPGPAQPTSAGPGRRTDAAQEDDDKILGDWILENAAGNEMSPMQISRTPDGTYALTRIGGGPYAVCGDYALAKEQLIKVRKPGDAYWDTAWRHTHGKFVVMKGQYKGWTLRREKNRTR